MFKTWRRAFVDGLIDYKKNKRDIPNSRIESKNHTLLMTKMIKEPHPLGHYAPTVMYVAHIMEYPPFSPPEYVEGQAFGSLTLDVWQHRIKASFLPLLNRINW